MAPFSFTPENCGPGGTAVPCGDTEKAVAETPAQVNVTPYWVYDSAQCVVTDRMSYDEAVGRATRSLETNTSYLTELGLWSRVRSIQTTNFVGRTNIL